MSGLIMQPESISAILSGKKTMTRRLVKKTEFVREFVTGKWQTRGFEAVAFGEKKKIIKWQVGKDYAITGGRGIQGAIYCPHCRQYSFNNSTFNHWNSCELRQGHNWNPKDLKSLRVRLLSIKKERLLGITEEDAKKEGFDSRAHFWAVFEKINMKVAIKELKAMKTHPGFTGWNPFVWVLSFEVV